MHDKPTAAAASPVIGVAGALEIDISEHEGLDSNILTDEHGVHVFDGFQREQRRRKCRVEALLDFFFVNVIPIAEFSNDLEDFPVDFFVVDLAVLRHGSAIKLSW